MGERQSAGLMDDVCITKIPKFMQISVDPLLLLQIGAVVFIILTMPNDDSTSISTDHSPAAPEPFLLHDGNTYVEHAGMTIEQELYELIAPRA